MALIKNVNCISPNATRLPSQGSRSDTLLTIWLHLLLVHHSTLILTSLASFRFRGSPRIYRIYHCAHSPRFYGLPKIHKPGIPLRPIVLLLILRLMQFLVILREFCRLLLGILITLSKIPANLRISEEIKLLTLVNN